MRVPLIALALLGAVSSAFAGSFGSVKAVQIHTGTKTLSGYDEFHFVGWRDSCAVGLQYYSFPPTGTGLQGTPDRWRVGTLSVRPGEDRERAEWSYSSGENLAWDRGAAAKAVLDIRESGFDKLGHVELIRLDRAADQPGLEALLRSTSSFETGYRVKWPPERYRLQRVHYSPLGTCVLCVFRDVSRPRNSYFFRLVRILDPGLRRKRARAHVSNALLLFRNQADMAGALEELRIAATTDPGFPLALYHFGRMLALHGRYDEAMDHLERAVARDASFRGQAERAGEFAPVEDHPRFQAIIHPEKKR